MNIETTQNVLVTPARYVLLRLAEELTGYTVKAIQAKIARGYWQEGKVCRRAPDGRILIDMVGYEKWVETDASPPAELMGQSGKRSPIAPRVLRGQSLGA